MAGPVTRPSLDELRPDWRGAQSSSRSVGARAFGDDGLLSAVVRNSRRRGSAWSAQMTCSAICARRRARAGRVAPDEAAAVDIAGASRCCARSAISTSARPWSCSRAWCSASRRSRARMRCSSAAPACARSGRGGVLVKIAKPGQERRVDLPTIGPGTVARAAAAGLRGIALEAERSLIIDRAAVVRRRRRGRAVRRRGQGP